MAHSCPNCRRTVEVEDALCLDCGAKVTEKREFRNDLLIGFEAAMLQIVSPEFYLDMTKEQKQEFLDGAYALYKIGYIDGIKKLGKECGIDGSNKEVSNG
jgi:hypothetical protein